MPNFRPIVPSFLVELLLLLLLFTCESVNVIDSLQCKDVCKVVGESVALLFQFYLPPSTLFLSGQNIAAFTIYDEMRDIAIHFIIQYLIETETFGVYLNQIILDSILKQMTKNGTKNKENGESLGFEKLEKNE